MIEVFFFHLQTCQALSYIIKEEFCEPREVKSFAELVCCSLNSDVLQLRSYEVGKELRDEASLEDSTACTVLVLNMRRIGDI